MSKAHSFNIDNNHESNIDTDSTAAASTSTCPDPAPIPPCHHLSKASFKSLTALSAKDSLENLQKIHRRSADGLRRGSLSGRGAPGNPGERRARKKANWKRCDKQNASEVNIRKAANDLVVDEPGALVSVVSSKKLASTGKSKHRKENLPQEGVAESASLVVPPVSAGSDSQAFEAPDVGGVAADVLQCFERLRVDEADDSSGKTGVDYSSGDGALKDEEAEEEEEVEDEEFELDYTGMAACARIFGAKRRSVQWKREVDVIYYAGDADGGKGRVVRRGNEPLREEAEQQARRNRFIQLALTKNLLSNVGACQLRDPWLLMLPK